MRVMKSKRPTIVVHFAPAYPGPDGRCVLCRKHADELCADGRRRDFRCGVCDECAFPLHAPKRQERAPKRQERAP